MPNHNPHVNFRAGTLTPELESRAGAMPIGALAKRDLERYYHTLRVTLATVDLSESEASLVADALNGTLFEPHTVPLLWAEVADAIRLDGLATKWSVDGAVLVTKLQSLSYAQSLAIIDASERFWTRVASGEAADSPLADQLRTVGLVKGEGIMFAMNQASQAVRRIARDERDMFGAATGWEPAADGGVYIQFKHEPQPRYYSGGDIMNAATSAEAR